MRHSALLVCIAVFLVASVVAADDQVTPPPRSVRVAFDDSITGDPNAIKDYTFTYTPTVTYRAQETVVAISAETTQKHREDHFGVTGEIEFSRTTTPQLDVIYDDGTRQTIAFSGRATLPAKRVARLVLHNKHYGKSWDVAWEVTSLPAARLSLSYRDASNPTAPAVVTIELGRQYVVDIHRDGDGNPPNIEVTIGEPGWSVTMSATRVPGVRKLYRTGPFVVYPKPRSPAR